MRRDGEEGMTLIELIISVTITVTLISAAAAAFSAGISKFRDTNTTFADSHDVQLLQTYLPVDIQSVQDSSAAGGQSDIVTTFNTAAGYCNSVGTNVIRFKWYDGTNTFRVDYRIQQDGTAWSLVRYACDTTLGSTTRTLVVGHELLAPTDAAWTSGGVPGDLCGTRVAVTVRLASGYSFTVSGNRRSPTTTPAPCKNFTMAIAPDTQTVKAGQSTSFTVTITPSGGFTGAITLTSPDLPSGTTATFTPVSFAAGETAPKTSTMTVTTSTSTPTGDAAFTVTGTAGAISRATGASLEVTGVVAPKVLQVEMYDGRTGAGTGTPNGKIDELLVLLDANLVRACNVTTDWTLVSPPLGTLVSSVTKVDPTHLDIKLTEGTAVDTAATAFKVIYTPTTCDADPIPAPGLDVVDRAGPIALGMATPSGNQTIAPGDTLEITFSENISACVPTSTTVGITSDNSNNDFLTLPNVIQGNPQIGSGYLKKKNEAVNFANSTVGCSGAKLTVTVGPTCGGANCGDIQAGSGSFTYLPVAAILKDAETPVPNTIVSTVAGTGGSIF